MAMADIDINFHATPSEVQDFVRKAVLDFNLHVIAILYPPYRADEIDPVLLNEAFFAASSCEELGFTLHRPRIPMKGDQKQIADLNPDVLRLMLGPMRKN